MSQTMVCLNGLHQSVQLTTQSVLRSSIRMKKTLSKKAFQTGGKNETTPGGAAEEGKLYQDSQ